MDDELDWLCRLFPTRAKKTRRRRNFLLSTLKIISHSLFFPSRLFDSLFLFKRHAPRRRLQGRGARTRGLVPVLEPHRERRVVCLGDGPAGEERERKRVFV